MSSLSEWQQALPNLARESCKPSPKGQDTGPPPTLPTLSSNTVSDPPASRSEADPSQEEHPDGGNSRPPSGQEAQTAVANTSSQDDQVADAPNNPDDGAGGKADAVADDAAVSSIETDTSCRTCCGLFRLMCWPFGQVLGPEIRKKPTQMWRFIRGRRGQATPGPDTRDEQQPIIELADRSADQPAEQQVTATPAGEQDVSCLNEAENVAEQSPSPPRSTRRATRVDVVYGQTFDINEVRFPENDLRPKQSNNYPELSTADYLTRNSLQSELFYDGFFQWFDRCPTCENSIAWGLPWSSHPEWHPCQSGEKEWRAPCIHCRQMLRATLTPLNQPKLTIVACAETTRQHRGGSGLPTVPEENSDNGEGPSNWMTRRARADSTDSDSSNAVAGPVPDRKGKQKMREPQDGDKPPKCQDSYPMSEQPKGGPSRVRFTKPPATSRTSRLLERRIRGSGKPLSLDAVLSQEIREEGEEASTGEPDASPDPEQSQTDEDGMSELRRVASRQS